MKIIADATVDLPFKLNFCAKEPDMEPIIANIGGFACTLYFPPSMSETTDGQGIFGEWAWWTGMRLRVVMEKDDIDDASNSDAVRDLALTAGNELLRRLLNAYRWRFTRPDVHPVQLDTRHVSLIEVRADGSRVPMPEPESAFFYQNMPSEPPLSTSINSTTQGQIQDDIVTGTEPPIAVLIELDAEAVEAQGDFLRADLLRGLARQQLS